MKATITINRRIVAKNKKEGEDLEPAISIRTYKSTEYAKRINIKNAALIQDMKSSRCNGATIWIECDREDVEILE